MNPQRSPDRDDISWPGTERAAALSGRSSAPRSGRVWTDVAVPAMLMLVVSVPTMVIEEDWHGHPMIDEPTHLWMIAACLVAAAFLAGGAVAGIRRPANALQCAVAAGGGSSVVLIVAGLCRRLWVAHEGVPGAVVRLWFFGVLTALILSATGALMTTAWRRSARLGRPR